MKQVKRQFGQWSRVLAMLCCLLPKMAQSDEGLPKQLDGDSSQIILGLCQSSTGLVLSAGRSHWSANTPKFYPGSVQQFTTSSTTGVKGDPTFQAAGASNSNLNATLTAVENGAAYYDAGNTQVENLVVSCAYDSG
ncbi:MAG: hypothetical protein ACKOA8_14600, partial [Deltaproteobacteria bacterium]